MRSMFRILLLFVLSAIVAAPGVAAVADSAPGGFTVKTSVAVHATPEVAYKRVIAIGDWWSSDHTFSGDAHNLTLEAKAGGCFCEKLPNGGAVRHQEVIFVQPNKRLVLDGGLGPLETMAVAARMIIALDKQGDGTQVTLTFTVGGYAPGGLTNLAAPVDQVLTQQVTRLQNLIDRGDPAKAAQ